MLLPAVKADDSPPDVAYAMRWWNVLNADQMVAALYGSTATAEQATTAKKLYSILDPVYIHLASYPG